jgi:hypothetical protein
LIGLCPLGRGYFAYTACTSAYLHVNGTGVFGDQAPDGFDCGRLDVVCGIAQIVGDLSVGHLLVSR